ncbi:MAG TPA: MFS transporter [Firmicutes bacterium]|nr:MFS transporter [Bacillota bacterium]
MRIELLPKDERPAHRCFSAWFGEGGFSLLLGGQALSVLGDFFGIAAQSVLVYRLTGSKVAMGTLWLCHFLPMVLFRLVSGPLLDRLDRRRLLMAAEWTRVAVFAAPALLYFTGLLRVWHLFGFALITGAAEAVFFPVLMALVPDLVPEQRLAQANALIEGSRNVVSLVGPALGAAFVQLWGPGPALLVDACSFAASAVSVQLLRPPIRQPAHAGGEKPFLKRLAEGYRFFRVREELLWLAGALAVVNAAQAATFAQFLPYATEQLGTSVAGMGMLESAIALGALLGTFAAGLCGEIRWRSLSLLGSLVVSGLALMAMGLTDRFAVALLLAAGFGASGPFFNIVYMTLYQRLVPGHLRARVFALRMVFATSAMPLGSFLGGVVAEAWGLRALFLLAGLVSALSAGVVYVHPSLRRIDGDLEVATPFSG